MKSTFNPLVPNGPVKLIEKISPKTLIKEYQDQLGVDIKRIISKRVNISMYQCQTTGYQFFSPQDIAGDGQFYKDLSKFHWYYMPWKWEHQIISDMLSPKDSVLEIGCGPGSFLKKIKSRVTRVVGLELSQDAVEQAQSQDLKVHLQSIESFAKKNVSRFSMVATFQVLEHIAHVRSFLDAAITCLKPGGKLVVSVPNNISSSPIISGNILNLPPHHMGRWDTNSLAKLTHILPLQVEAIYTEPLQAYHEGFFDRLAIESLIKAYPVLNNVPKSYIRIVINKVTKAYSPYILGHSILIIYKKLV